MKLPFLVKVAEEVPAGLAEYYEQGTDGLRLRVEGAVPIAEHYALRQEKQKRAAEHDKVQAELEELKKSLEGIEDLSAFRQQHEDAKQELAQLRDANKDTAAKLAEAKAQFEQSTRQRIEQLEAKQRAALDEATKENERLHQIMTREKLMGLVASSPDIIGKTRLGGLPPNVVLGALSSLEGRLGVEEANGAFVVVAYDQFDSKLTAANGQTATGKDALRVLLDIQPNSGELYQTTGGGAGSSGGGGGGGGMKNPWAKDSFNLTEQGKILKEKPELAKRLKAEAGA